MTRSPAAPPTDRTRTPEALEPQDAHGMPGYPGRATDQPPAPKHQRPPTRPMPPAQDRHESTELGIETPEQDNDKVG
ncbi:hypothetical protein [Pseudomonas sp. MRSN 12121]|uniref:hypothetical protein n=1 Tax=Pseudomonas sp. MRSN 12121 TaxID=1611770 RepID=UPI0005BEC9B4|nr:hypothetical protein [Pseudomonas sp. MRSN 12121]AJO81737.1 hypothetical protein TO66_15875 [Pseudomonas sp. MRSN 12121]